MRSLPVLLLAILPCLPAAAAPLSAERARELQNLLHQDCGSCHGMRLTGGLGPALTAQALAGKPRELLVATIRDGRAGTPMPPWKTLLGEDDIAWLVDTLMEAGQTP
ncbi:MAG: cytochrome c [Gammaproteobacteria bacterium]